MKNTRDNRECFLILQLLLFVKLLIILFVTTSAVAIIGTVAHHELLSVVGALFILAKTRLGGNRSARARTNIVIHRYTKK